MRSILAKSLFVDFLLTSICLSRGDNPRDVPAAWRVGDNDCSTGEQAQGDKPFLSIIETVVYEGDARPGQHLFGVRKVQTVFGGVALVLRFVPFIYHPIKYLLL
jgi:hypothetical protein